MTTITSTVNPFAIPANCNKSNPSPAYPAFKALSIWIAEAEGVHFEEGEKLHQLAYAALEEFFTNTLGGDKEEMLCIYNSYVEDNNLWELYDKLGGDSGMDDFTGFDQFMLFHKPDCWMVEEE